MAATICACLLDGPHSARAVDLMGLAQSAAIDQPQVYMSLSNSAGGTPIEGQTEDPDPSDPFGTVPTIGIQAYLDTGSSGLLISTATAQAWGLANSTYNGQTVTFNDIGVGGTAVFNVSLPLYAGVAPYTPTTNTENAAGYLPVTSGGTQTSLRLEIGPADTGNDTLTGDLDDSFLEDIDVVGMPALAGKVMVVDARSSNGVMTQLANPAPGTDPLDYLLTNPTALDDLSLKTYVYNSGTPFRPSTINTDPGIPTTNLHVKLSYADFTGFTTIAPGGAPGPTLAHNPFIGPNPLAPAGTDHTPPVRITFEVPDTANPAKMDTLATTGSFLFDTGAGSSFISENLAAKLHVRYRSGTEGTDDPELEIFNPANPSAPGTLLTNQFQESVGGIGGDVTVAGFYLDSLIIPTQEANPSYWTDPRNIRFAGTRTAGGQQDVLGPPVLVQNITATKGSQSITLDGDLGVNFLVGSLNLSGDIDDLSIGGFAPGAFDWLTFDEAAGALGLQLNSAFHIAGDFNLDGKLTNADTQAMLNAFKNIPAFEAAHHLSNADWLDLADVNRDGVVNEADLKYLMNLLTGSKLYLAGDFNFDGKLTSADLQAMLNAFQNISSFEAAHDLSDAAWEQLGDVNGDGTVNFSDELALMKLLDGASSGGSSGSSSLSAVPEPPTAMLASLAVVGLVLSGRKAGAFRFLAPAPPAQFSAAWVRQSKRRAEFL
ncbi:MAG TPA: dockerin type I domain-containing protein [Pirellulales bacterium]|nr:dockerin type I domain-containing protein [Pirellulales bacterium]